MTEMMHEAFLASRTETQSRTDTDPPKRIQHALRVYRAWIAGALLSVLPTTLAAGEPTPVQPVTEAVKGSLVIAGGGVLPSIIRERFVELAGGKEAKIVVIPTASADADIAEKQQLFLWDGLRQSVKSAQLFHTRDRAVADDEDSTQILDDATGIWIGGGVQKNVVDAYKNTKVVRKIWQVLDKGGVVGGTSAGAAVMSRDMIQRSIKNPLDGSVEPEMGEGFGFLPGSIVDQHFISRNRLDRLQKAMHSRPGLVGIGVDEGTALEVKRSGKVRVIGNSTVSIFTTGEPVILGHGEEAELSSFGMPTVEVSNNMP